jgi:hypothetical protein
MVSEVATKLASELATLHAKVVATPFFNPPSELTRDLIPRIPEIVEMTSQSRNLPPRNSRAISLPPNPELIHSRPSPEYNNEEREEKKLVVEPQKFKVETRHDVVEERRSLADGIPQFQPFWYVYL